ncbi:unnamed protein product [Vitrella brassicaformis CCMP3155]|uniref:Uncharacterized protein n=1 Tax=Vitrella brassicaformis (strain CCMP3155) TaxID=1169540 RepID=A0A0G4FVK7_VITBC|nr:unnamed protein product [Vitrella brassicaformis CCMP3155]|mmetsp:Transcript_26796/g.66697  ORF Transcript_26796/g.66697 Transcript_26796/m.66697 type:complete len:124 (-) Transcript_26796:107-478(-)|eukprot:CEM19253.1 unnamed protein product [Vitrella brassicaformis CCMP3155]
MVWEILAVALALWVLFGVALLIHCVATTTTQKASTVAQTTALTTTASTPRDFDPPRQPGGSIAAVGVHRQAPPQLTAEERSEMRENIRKAAEEREALHATKNRKMTGRAATCKTGGMRRDMWN